MKTYILIGTLYLLPLINMAQSKETEGHIMWAENYRLVWEDFQGRAKKSHVASAMSDITFSVSIKSEGKNLDIYVQPSFNPKGSWVKEEDKVDELLKHEQVHFDIYEVNARKLRQELKTKNLTTTNAEETLGRLIKKYSELNVKIQERYDSETDHSLKTEKQEKWNAQVAADLVTLEEFKEPVFRVRMEK